MQVTGCESIARALPANESLTCLDLSRNKFFDQGPSRQPNDGQSQDTERHMQLYTAWLRSLQLLGRAWLLTCTKPHWSDADAVRPT